MFAMLAKLWAMLGTLIDAFGKFASAFEHLGNVADETAAQYEDEARIVRKAKYEAMLKENNVTPAQLTNNQP